MNSHQPPLDNEGGGHGHRHEEHGLGDRLRGGPSALELARAEHERRGRDGRQDGARRVAEQR
jgi:hypothetical protein